MNKNTERKLIVREQKVDWLKIIDNVLSRKDWGKTYTFLSLGDTKINVLLNEIDFPNSTVWFKLKLTTFYETKDLVGEPIIREHFDTSLVSFRLENFSLANFQMHANRRIRTLISDNIVDINRNIAKNKYKHLRFSKNFNLSEQAIEEAGFKAIYDMVKKDSMRNFNTIDGIKNDALAVLNEAYNNSVDNYTKNELYKHDELEQLYSIMDKRILADKSD